MVRGGNKLEHSEQYSYKSPVHEKPGFHYLLLILVIAAGILSVVSLSQVNDLRSQLIPQTVSTDDFLKKLVSHEQMRAFVGVSPLNIIQINSNNLGNLQAQINGLDSTYIGSFLVQYSDAIVVYDYNNDEIKGNVALQQPQQAALPGDFFTKLYSHSELGGLESEQPVGGQIDANSLSTLKQQFPDVYANAKVGDFLLRYSTRLVIYDYNADSLVNLVELG
jgi:hypothetical protein